MSKLIDNKKLNQYSVEELKLYLDLFINIDSLNEKLSGINELNPFYFTIVDVIKNNLKFDIKYVFFNFYKIFTEAKALVIINDSSVKAYEFNKLISFFNDNPDSEAFSFKRYLKVYEDIFVQAEFTETEDVYIIDNDKLVFWIEEYGYFIIQFENNNAKTIYAQNEIFLSLSYKYFEQSLKRIKNFYEMKKMNQFLSENIDRIGEFELMSRYILSSKEIDILLKRFYGFLTKKSFVFNQVCILTVDDFRFNLYSYRNGKASFFENINIFVEVSDLQGLNDCSSETLQVLKQLYQSQDVKLEEIVLNLNSNYVHYVSAAKNMIILLFFEKDEKNGIDFSSEKLNFLIWNFETTFKKLLYYNKIKDLSKRDGLTGLYNHSYLHKKLKDTILDIHDNKNDCKSAYALFIDLNNFKLVNDTHGHVFGDYILKQVSYLFEKIFYEDSLISRYGGDEFVILLYNYTKEKLEDALDNKLIPDIARIADDISDVKLGISIGVGLIDDETPKNNAIVLDKIDKAMYEAKRKDGSFYVYAE